MSPWRPISRLVLSLLPAAVLLVPAVVIQAVLACLGQRARGARLRVGAGFQRLWARATLALIGVELDLAGAPPRGRWILVANHVSYLDILVLAALFPCRFVAKSEIAGWPLLGPLSRLSSTIFIERGQKRDVVRVGAEIARSLAAGLTVAIFPEGGSSAGERVGHFHSALLENAARLEVACMPVALSYETPGDPWAPSITVCWWGGMALWPHALRLLSLRSIRARVRWGEPVIGSDRKRLASESRARVAELFEPIVQEPPPPFGPRGVATALTRE